MRAATAAARPSSSFFNAGCKPLCICYLPKTAAVKTLVYTPGCMRVNTFVCSRDRPKVKQAERPHIEPPLFESFKGEQDPYDVPMSRGDRTRCPGVPKRRAQYSAGRNLVYRDRPVVHISCGACSGKYGRAKRSGARPKRSQCRRC